jgi:polysaccharide export outer membrane protein
MILVTSAMLVVGIAFFVRPAREDFAPMRLHVESVSLVRPASATRPGPATASVAEHKVADGGQPRPIVADIVSAARPVGRHSNQRLAEKIVKAIKAVDPRGFEIDIDVRDGVATLTGFVSTQEDRSAVETAAASVSGIARVDNRLELWKDKLTAISAEPPKLSIPPYRVEAPDVLILDMVNNIRPADDPLRFGDELFIRVSGTLPIDAQGDEIENAFKQINNLYRVQADATVDLGPEYGSVIVDGLTLKETKTAIEQHLIKEVGLAAPKVAVSLPIVNGKQVISGEHLIRPDGTVQLGVYGSVYVNRMTLDEVKAAVEKHLARYVPEPEIVVDVGAYNSKTIFIVTEGGDGKSVVRIPFTGNETVLTAISQIDGLSKIAAEDGMWVARPGADGGQAIKKLPVDWRAMTQEANWTTNYQLFPGDRIKADPLIAADSFISKITVPVSRLFGFALQGNGTVRPLRPEILNRPNQIEAHDTINVSFEMRRPDKRLRAGDELFIRQSHTPPRHSGSVKSFFGPISGFYTVGTDGTVDLGSGFGSVSVAGLTLPEAKTAIEKQLTGGSGRIELQVTVSQKSGRLGTSEEYLVAPDGTVQLGAYGSVPIAGMTLHELKRVIQERTSQSTYEPCFIVVVGRRDDAWVLMTLDGDDEESVLEIPETSGIE